MGREAQKRKEKKKKKMKAMSKHLTDRKPKQPGKVWGVSHLLSKQGNAN